MGKFLFILIIVLFVLFVVIALSYSRWVGGNFSDRNILIFGTGPDEQVAWSNHFINESEIYQDADFSTADLQCSPDSIFKCYKLDFNNLDELRELPNDTFTTIMFDWSTSKSLEWKVEHLEEIKKKLKEFGELLIPNPIGVSWVGSENYPDDKIITYINIDTDVPAYKFRPTEEDKQSRRNIVHTKNLRLLNKAFGNSIKMNDNKYPFPETAHEVKKNQMKNIDYYKMIKVSY